MSAKSILYRARGIRQFKVTDVSGIQYLVTVNISCEVPNAVFANTWVDDRHKANADNQGSDLPVLSTMVRNQLERVDGDRYQLNAGSVSATDSDWNGLTSASVLDIQDSATHGRPISQFFQCPDTAASETSTCKNDAEKTNEQFEDLERLGGTEGGNGNVAPVIVSPQSNSSEGDLVGHVYGGTIKLAGSVGNASTIRLFR